jgi:colanic acid/amylovoran biosynthesis glycosyltransferase
MRELSEQKRQVLFRYGQLFLVNTHFAQAELETLGCPRDKIVILPLGSRLEEFPFWSRPCPQQGPVIVLTVARLAPEKGHTFAREAIKELIE